MWNISCELDEFVFDVNLCLDVYWHLYLVNCYLYCLFCHYASFCIVGGHNSHSWFKWSYVSLIIDLILCIGIAYWDCYFKLCNDNYLQMVPAEGLLLMKFILAFGEGNLVTGKAA